MNSLYASRYSLSKVASINTMTNFPQKQSGTGTPGKTTRVLYLRIKVTILQSLELYL
jgi:hypothetical protein